MVYGPLYVKRKGAENKELQAGLRSWRGRKVKESQGGQGLPSRRESGLEEEWRMELDRGDEVEGRKKAG